jgi:uncharacterized protein with PQ loop repeat
MHEYLMNIASAFFFICYIPSLYDTIHAKHVNIYSLPDKILIFIGSSLAFSYSFLNNDTSLMTNYGPIVVLDLTGLLIRAYRIYSNDFKQIEHLSDTEEKNEFQVNP